MNFNRCLIYKRNRDKSFHSLQCAKQFSPYNADSFLCDYNNELFAKPSHPHETKTTDALEFFVFIEKVSQYEISFCIY